MQLFNWLSTLAFGLLVSAAEPPTELKIDTTYVPADCSTKAQKGDAIKVHYVSQARSVKAYVCPLTGMWKL